MTFKWTRECLIDIQISFDFKSEDGNHPTAIVEEQEDLAIKSCKTLSISFL